MPIAARTLAEVRRTIWANLDDLVLVTAAAGTTATALVASAPLPGASGEWKMAGVWVAARNGFARVIDTTFDASNVPTFALHPAIAGLTAGDVADLHVRFAKDRVDQALQQAHDELIGWVLVDVVDTSLTGSQTTSEYAVPSTWTGIHLVEVQKADGHWYALLPDEWELVRTGSPATTKLKIALDRLAQIDGRPLRLRGYANPTYPASETVVFQVPPGYLVASATARLLAGPLENPQTDPQGKLANLQYWAAQREIERRRARTPIAPNTKFFV